MRSARKVVCITESDHWADYAEMQREPKPNFTIDHGYFWPGACILMLVIVIARLIW